ncbi:hypothetical protein M885DRAFT_615638, partial [Pelagophyceae sp. CCMP2097]
MLSRAAALWALALLAPTASPALTRTASDCAAALDLARVGDGVCDAGNAYAPCFDGGDCCPTGDCCPNGGCGRRLDEGVPTPEPTNAPQPSPTVGPSEPTIGPTRSPTASPSAHPLTTRAPTTATRAPTTETRAPTTATRAPTTMAPSMQPSLSPPPSQTLEPTDLTDTAVPTARGATAPAPTRPVVIVVSSVSVVVEGVAATAFAGKAQTLTFQSAVAAQSALIDGADDVVVQSAVAKPAVRRRLEHFGSARRPGGRRLAGGAVVVIFSAEHDTRRGVGADVNAEFLKDLYSSITAGAFQRALRQNLAFASATVDGASLTSLGFFELEFKTDRRDRHDVGVAAPPGAVLPSTILAVFFALALIAAGAWRARAPPERRTSLRGLVSKTSALFADAQTHHERFRTDAFDDAADDFDMDAADAIVLEMDDVGAEMDDVGPLDGASDDDDVDDDDDGASDGASDDDGDGASDAASDDDGALEVNDDGALEVDTGMAPAVQTLRNITLRNIDWSDELNIFARWCGEGEYYVRSFGDGPDADAVEFVRASKGLRLFRGQGGTFEEGVVDALRCTAPPPADAPLSPRNSSPFSPGSSASQQARADLAGEAFDERVAAFRKCADGLRVPWQQGR